MINISRQIYVKNMKIEPKLRPRLSGMFELSKKKRRFWEATEKLKFQLVNKKGV